MKAKLLMVLGTMSSVGKSFLTTGLCRVFHQMGFRVSPFKAQNMSNNAAVCKNGSEIGRAQFTQALASGIIPSYRNNPILIKPESNNRSQVIVNGRPWKTLSAGEYYKHKSELWGHVVSALETLRKNNDIIVIEGAGSPVELNLKAGDIVNTSVAKYFDANVLLVGDIDRGGIFAQLLGTLMLLEDDERRLIKGLVVNKFRGDLRLFEGGVSILQKKSHLPVIGVIPYFKHFLPEEDSVSIESQNYYPQKAREVDIVVIRLPRISNFDDFDLIKIEPDISLRYVDNPLDIGTPNAIILPGTKSTIDDLMWLRDQHLDTAITKYAKNGGVVVGICGGYQILGSKLYDPFNIESNMQEANGLNLLNIETTFAKIKDTYQVKAMPFHNNPFLENSNDISLEGYEIHMGNTRRCDVDSLLKIVERNQQEVEIVDGAISKNGKVWGTYIHGIFHNHKFKINWLRSIGWKRPEDYKSGNLLEETFDQVANQIRISLDIPKILDILDL